MPIRRLPLIAVVVAWGQLPAQKVCGHVLPEADTPWPAERRVALMRDSGLVLRTIDSTTTDGAGEFCMNAPTGLEYIVALRRYVGGPALTGRVFLTPDVAGERKLAIDALGDTLVARWGRETPVRPHGATVAVRYPKELRQVCAFGGAVALFVVDTAGRVMPGSALILRSDDALFSREVLAGLSQLRFDPATVDGFKVRKLVQMPFDFRPSREIGCP